MKTIENKTKLIKKYHAICAVTQTDIDMMSRLMKSYKVESISELPEEKIEKLINELARIPDMWRKRVMASIGGWLKLQNIEGTGDMIKGIACRASGNDNFNKITVPRLRDIYYEFLSKQKIAKSANAVKGLIVAEIASKN